MAGHSRVGLPLDRLSPVAAKVTMNTAEIIAALKATPKGGTFTWPTIELGYVKALRDRMGRQDIKIVTETRKP
jgi:hypothetical protein